MIVDLLTHWAQSTPHQPFVVTAGRSHSYREIHASTRRFAGRLRADGIARGDHVALIAGNSAAYLVAWFAINALGAVAVCLNNQLMGDSIDYLVGQSDAKLIICDAEWRQARHGDLRGARSADLRGTATR